MQLYVAFMLLLLKNRAVPVIFRKVFADEVQKLSADVCLCVHTVGWIKPNPRDKEETLHGKQL